MTDDDRDLAEQAALAMGWQPWQGSTRGVPRCSATPWCNADGDTVPDPSLDDPAFWGAMLEWLLAKSGDWGLEIAPTIRDLPDGVDGLQIQWNTLESVQADTLTAALARAVIAAKEEA